MQGVNEEVEYGICAHGLKVYRDDYIADIDGEPSDYEQGKIDLFNELIELLENHK